MSRNIVLAAVAGLASGAAAQSASLSIVASNSYGGPSNSFTLSVYGDADFGTHITGAAFSLNATGGGDIESMTATSASWGALGFDDLGHTGGGNTGMIMGQITFLPFIQPDAASALGNGPVFLGSFLVTVADDAGYGVATWTIGGGIGTFALEVIDVNANPGGNPPGEVTGIAAPSFGSISVVIVPAPSAMALLGLGGLVVGRRRR